MTNKQYEYKQAQIRALVRKAVSLAEAHPVLLAMTKSYAETLIDQALRCDPSQIDTLDAIMTQLVELIKFLNVIAWANEESVSFWIKVAVQYHEHCPKSDQPLKDREWAFDEQDNH